MVHEMVAYSSVYENYHEALKSHHCQYTCVLNRINPLSKLILLGFIDPLSSATYFSTNWASLENTEMMLALIKLTF